MSDFQYLQPIPEVARMLRISDRRLRQFVETGAIPRLERGKIDFGWALHYYAGSKMVEAMREKPNTLVMVALAWATGQGSEFFKTQREHLVELFERNGKSRDDALMALGHAQALMSR